MGFYGPGLGVMTSLPPTLHWPDLGQLARPTADWPGFEGYVGLRVSQELYKPYDQILLPVTSTILSPP